MATDVIKETNRSICLQLLDSCRHLGMKSSELTKIIEIDLYSLDLLDIRYAIDLKCFENRKESKR